MHLNQQAHLQAHHHFHHHYTMIHPYLHPQAWKKQNKNLKIRRDIFKPGDPFVRGNAILKGVLTIGKDFRFTMSTITKSSLLVRYILRCEIARYYISKIQIIFSLYFLIAEIYK